MADPASLILRTLDRHLAAPGHLRLMGGAALIIAYGLNRGTEDADLLLDDRELQLLIDEANFGEALDATNAELEQHGLYISHIWGPEQQILTPGWRLACRRTGAELDLARLSLSVLGPLDLLVSKLCRADDGDMEDIRWLVVRERLEAEAIRAAMRSARVPAAFRDLYPEAVARVEALLLDLARGG